MLYRQNDYTGNYHNIILGILKQFQVLACLTKNPFTYIFVAKCSTTNYILGMGGEGLIVKSQLHSYVFQGFVQLKCMRF